MATKNLEKYYEHRPVADLTSLGAISTVGIVNGVIVEVASDGLFQLQIPAVATPDGRDKIEGNGGGVWLRQTIPVLTTTVGGAIALSSGGTGGLTQQTALNSIAGVITNALFLRGDGANVSMSAIQVADVPTLNQNTTGTASNVTGVVAIANGGTNAATQQAALNSIAGAVTTGQYLRGNGSNVLMSAIQVADVPTLNQNTTGTAAKATNISGGAANKIPYQAGIGVTGFLNTAANAVLVTNGSGVPSMSTTAPAFNSGATICTDPSTSGPNALNTALLNIYNHASAPDLANSSAYYTYFALNNSDFTNWQLIPGTTITLNPGRYLITFKSNGEMQGTYTGPSTNTVWMDAAIVQSGLGTIGETSTILISHFCSYNIKNDSFIEFGGSGCSYIRDVSVTTSFQVAAHIYTVYAYTGSLASTVNGVIINATKIADLII